jgi:hypothetical protein
MSYVNQYMLRLGFVNCVCAVAQRELDSLAAVHRRFDELVFRRVYDDEPDFLEMLSGIDPVALDSLQKLPTRRKEVESPLVSESRERKGRHWYFTGEMWVAAKGLPSHVGYPSKPHSEEYIELARALGLILNTYALSEIGYLISWRMTGGDARTGGVKPGVNPLAVSSDEITKLCLLYSVLSRDILAPFILSRLSEESLHAMTDIVRLAAEDLLSTLREDAGVQDILVVKEAHKFLERLSSQPVRRNQLRPRVEHYVDLALLNKRQPTDDPIEAGYTTSIDHDTYQRAFQGLLERPLFQEKWMDSDFFRAAGLLYDRRLRDPEQTEVLRYFVRAFPAVKRGIGFTPGRTVALLAGMQAWGDGVRLEIDRSFDEVYAAARGPHAKLLQFSGGSRLDREFLISVRPEAEVEIGSLESR